MRRVVCNSKSSTRQSGLCKLSFAPARGGGGAQRQAGLKVPSARTAAAVADAAVAAAGLGAARGVVEAQAAHDLCVISVARGHLVLCKPEKGGRG